MIQIQNSKTDDIQLIQDESQLKQEKISLVELEDGEIDNFNTQLIDEIDRK